MNKVAAFVDGCFSHGLPAVAGCPTHRDQFVNRELRNRGWRVLRIWEHDLAAHPQRCLHRIRKALHAEGIQHEALTRQTTIH